MNIIFLCSQKAWNGDARYIFDLTFRLLADEITVKIIANRASPLRKFEHSINVLGKPVALTGLKSLIAPVRIASELNRLSGPKTIVTFNTHDAALALNARKLAADNENIKVTVVYSHDTSTENVALRSKTYTSADSLIFTSFAARKLFETHNPDADVNRMHVIHNSANIYHTENDKPAPPPSRIIYSGSITPEKGLGELIKALSMMESREWELTVCGSGRGRSVMPIVRSARSAEIYDKIDWTGFTDDVFSKLQKSHIAVIPSSERITTGASIIEAMASGCAIIACEGFAEEFIKNEENGLIVPPNNPHALCDALTRLVENHQLCMNLGNKALETFTESFSYPVFYSKTLKVFTH